MEQRPQLTVGIRSAKSLLDLQHSGQLCLVCGHRRHGVLKLLRTVVELEQLGPEPRPRQCASCTYSTVSLPLLPDTSSPLLSTEAARLRQRSGNLDGAAQRAAWRKLAMLEAVETLRMPHRRESPVRPQPKAL